MNKNPFVSFLIVVVALMIHATLYPYHFQVEHSEFLTWYPAETRGGWLDILMNLYFFMPLGILCGICFRSRQGFVFSFLGGVGLSLGVEVMQAYIPGRFSSLRDVFLNGVGAFLGLVVANLPIFDRELISAQFQRVISKRALSILAVLWFVEQFFPFVPLLRMHMLNAAIGSFQVEQLWSYGNVEMSILSGLLLLMLGETLPRKLFLVASGVMLLLVPLQIFLWGRPAPAAQMLTTWIGILAAVILVLGEVQIPVKGLCGLCVAMLVYRELQPLEWDLEVWNDFGWMPFKASFQVDRSGAIRILSLKCLLYWLTLRLLHQWTGQSLLRIAWIMAGFFLVAEWGQCYQLGRTPESTDAVLCLLGALPLLNLGEVEDQGLKRAAR
jgi:glycopeptide antibiotics resistance protein